MYAGRIEIGQLRAFVADKWHPLPGSQPVCFHCYRLKGTETVPERTVLL